MGPKPTPANQKNTLFSYFTKSPANTSVKSETVLSPKRSPNQKKKSPEKAEAKPKGQAREDPKCDYEIGDVVWCKLEGYPWWPGLVCNHPTANTHYKGGKLPQVHVQFFDNPPSRAWIKERNCRPFAGSEDKEFQKGGMFHSYSPPVIQGAAEADQALKLPRSDRLALIVELQPSDDDDEEEGDDQDMDVDASGESGGEDNSKENMDVEEDKIKKTPSKSPSKGRRSSRSKPKRRRIIVEDDSGESGANDSEDEFKLHPDDDGSGGEDDDSASSGVDEDGISSDDASEPDSPVKMPRKRKRPEPTPTRGPKTARRPITPSSRQATDSPSSAKKTLAGFSMDATEPREATTPSVSETTKSKLAVFTASDSVGPNGDRAAEVEATVYQHHKYEWLKPDKLRDANKKCKSDEDYDPRTLYIPEQEKTKFTPAMRQWWEIKSHHFDTVLFFKMGKFYELFHMDAVIAVTELGLIYMKGDYAHSGFPEIAYGRYADTLVQKGYKVARIEQTETPDMMNDRCKNMAKTPSKFDKVVRREVCRVTTRGTKTFSFLSGECVDSQSSYLLALAEKDGKVDGCSNYGVCFVDTSIGKFHVGQFEDDRHSSRLRTLLARFPPVQILHEKGRLTPRTLQVITNNLPSVMKEALTPRTEFWESSKTLRVLAEETYFKEDEKGDVVWPSTVKLMMSESDTLGCTAAEEYALAVSSLGAVTWYLQYSLLDEELLSMKNFELYQPLDNLACGSGDDASSSSQCSTSSGSQRSGSQRSCSGAIGAKHMVLDGVTLSNLDITENSTNGTLEGTLLERLDQCHTPFGKRLFRQWLCAPLCNPASIDDRLDAVDDLIGCQDVVAEVTEHMKKLPDLERLLSRIHTLGTKKGKNNPEGRAIMYEDVTYSKRKIEDFLATLDGFRVASSIARKFQGSVDTFRSQLLKKTMGLQGQSSDGCFPDLPEELKYFERSFDIKKAKKDGIIVPSEGVDNDYDEAVSDMKSTERELQNYLEKQRTRLGCRSMVYWGTAKNRYQLEVPDSAARNIPNEYRLMSSKKGAKRYRTTEIEDMFARMMDAEDRKVASLRDVMRRIFHSFDDKYKLWDTTVQCLSVLDVLLSLAQYSRCGDGPVCRPEIVLPSDQQQPFLEIRDARHPCICKTFAGGDFIPNDTVIGIPDEADTEVDEGQSGSKVVLVTGPNMGGKSTLMRQVGLVVVMAQMGCYVPAERCRLTPVDRVFTRLGASDRIMAGESTFFVELSETSSILQHATPHSLVLVDELGRGTATYDGTAIACSVVQELSRSIQCRTLFSTHYHSLVEEFSHDPNIRLGHMSCMVENEDETDPTQETITFLYKFTSGACPKSYGFNAARLANLPEHVISVAVEKAKEFEESLSTVRHFKSLWKDGTKDLIQLIQASC